MSLVAYPSSSRWSESPLQAITELLEQAARRETWRGSAGCSELPSELFFPLNEAAPDTERERSARRCCRQCPVQLACLRWALDSGQDYGIFGGLTGPERRRLQLGGHPRADPVDPTRMVVHD